MSYKRVGDLRINKKGFPVNEEATNFAVEKMIKLGKRKPHIYGNGMIRVHHRGKYFDYSVKTCKWIPTEYSSTYKWRKSESVRDFLKQIDAYMDKYYAVVDDYKKNGLKGVNQPT